MDGQSSESTAVLPAPRPPLAGAPGTAIDPQALRLGDRRLAVGEAASGWRVSRPWLLVGLFALIGLGLRLLLVRGIWVDEAISVHLAHMPFAAMLGDLRQTDVHPPLYFIALWGTVRALGFGELAIHTPSIIAGTLLIPAMFISGRELFDRRTGLVAAAICVVAPLLVWYSQEARDYAFVMLLMTLSVWAQSRAVRDGRARYWVAYTAINIAMLYTHYFTLIPIGIEQLAFAAVAWRRAHRGESVRGLLLACWASWIVLVIAVAPLAPFAYQQFHANQAAGFTHAPAPEVTSAGSSLSVYAVLSNLIWAIWGYHADSTMLKVAALWPLLMLLALALLGKGRSPQTLLVAALAVGPVAVLFVVGLLGKRELFEVRYFAAAVPMFLLLCARAVTAVSPRRAPVLVATGALFATVAVGCADQQLSSNNPRDYNFRGALTTIHDEAKPGDTLLYAPGYLRDVVDYYAPGIRARPLTAGPPNPKSKGRVFVMASFLDTQGVASQVGSARFELTKARGKPFRTRSLEKIKVWEYR